MSTRIGIITDSRCVEYHRPGHPERPARIERTVERLKKQDALKLDWLSPVEVREEQLTQSHDEALVRSVKAAASDFDADTAAHPNIYAHASRSVGGALKARAEAAAGRWAFSLLRPPGHHATRNHAMGFCYLNSIAIAAVDAAKTTEKRVVVFDFDVHHGNGTEDILLGKKHLGFISVHQYPCYPGTGTEDRGDNCFNFPVLPETPRMDYRKRLEKALEQLKRLKPSEVAVSAGFDAYARDPLAQGTLEAEDFEWLGKEMRGLGIPVWSVLEGGYSNELPELIEAYLRGLAG